MNKRKIMLIAINILVILLIIAHYLLGIQTDPHGDFPMFVGSVNFGLLMVFFAGEGIALIIIKH